MNRVRKISTGIVVALLLGAGASAHLDSMGLAPNASNALAKVDPIRPALDPGHGTVAKVDPVGPAQSPGRPIIAKVDPVRPNLNKSVPTLARVDHLRLLASVS